MKIIDLLNKIANGEEVPKKIKKNWEYEWQYDDNREEYCYMSKMGDRFDENWLVGNILNDEVEILEEEKKIPEKINEDNAIWEEQARDIDYYFKNTIDDIIDYLNYLKSKGDE